MNDETPQVVLPSPGRSLREAREAQGLSEEAVAQKLYLTVQHVQRIESDNYQGSPGLTFERGYLRNYARLLGLSEEQVIGDFNALGITEMAKTNAAYQQTEVPLRSEKHRHWITYLVLLGCAILLVMWWQGQHNRIQAEHAKLSQAEPTVSAEASSGKTASPEAATSIAQFTPAEKKPASKKTKESTIAGSKSGEHLFA